MSTNTISRPHADAGETIQRLALELRVRPVWLRVGQLIDGLSAKPFHNADVVFDAQQIRFVGTDGMTPDRALLAPGQRAPDAVLPDSTLLPCLIEAHAHLFLDGAPVDFQKREAYLKQPAAWMLARARARRPKILQCGVGAVRDAGDKHGVGLALAAEAKERSKSPSSPRGGVRGGAEPAPWIDSPGAAIHHRGKYGSFLAEPIEDFASAAECVAARVAAGADRIKLLASGIINFEIGRVTAPPQMSADEVAALVDAARRHGRQTFAHASGSAGIENAIEGGVTTVEHGFFITRDQLAKMRDRRIGWVPTFAPVQLQIDRAADLGWSDAVVGHLRRILDAHRKMLRRAYEMGVRIVAGSDAGSCGVPHGLGLVDELCQMEHAGVPSMAVLRSATGVSAATLDFREPIGRIAAGCRARMILTKHDPLATIANLRKEKLILFDGHAVQGAADPDPQGL